MTDKIEDKTNTDQSVVIVKRKGGGPKGIPCPGRGKRVVIKAEGDTKPVRIQNGLWTKPHRWGIDGRHPIAKQLNKMRLGLEAIFPSPGPDMAAATLITRICYKTVKLTLFEALDVMALAGPWAEEGTTTDKPHHRPARAPAPTSTTPRQEKPGTATGGSGFGDANFVRYCAIANSLREDLRLLCNMARAQSPTASDPDLQEYLTALKRASKATPVNVVNIERE
jgi:hypothetical protein